MFAVKNFSPLVQVAKIYHAKKKNAKISRSTVDREMFAVKKRRWRKFLRMEIYHAEKKEREHFPIYGISVLGDNIRILEEVDWFT